MNQQIVNIDYKWLMEPTGDPFADVGGYALKEFAKRFPEKNILELIEEVSKIYVNRWEAKIIGRNRILPDYRTEDSIVCCRSG